MYSWRPATRAPRSSPTSAMSISRRMTSRRCSTSPSARISRSPSSVPKGRLVAGIVDRFAAARRRCFGPTRAAARLEGSKAFTKDFLRRYAIPTASYAAFTAAELRCALCAGAALAAGRQGRWARRRQGRGDLRDARSGDRHGHRHARRQLRRRRQYHRHRGVPERRRGQLHRGGPRRPSDSARHLAGPQAPRRRRSRPQYRRHGRVFAGAPRHAGAARAHHARGDTAHAGADCDSMGILIRDFYTPA